MYYPSSGTLYSLSGIRYSTEYINKYTAPLLLPVYYIVLGIVRLLVHSIFGISGIYFHLLSGCYWCTLNDTKYSKTPVSLYTAPKYHEVTSEQYLQPSILQHLVLNTQSLKSSDN